MRVIVVGAGGLASEVIWAIRRANEASPVFELLGVVTDFTENIGHTLGDAKLLGTISTAIECFGGTNCGFIIAIGNNKARKRISYQLLEAAFHAVTVIDPSAIVAPNAKIGVGAYIAAGAIVSANAHIGDYAIVNFHASVGHDATIEQYVQLCPGARVSGACVLKEGCFLGSNAIAAPKTTVGEWAVLGAGAFAHNDIPAFVTALVPPAKAVYCADSLP